MQTSPLTSNDRFSNISLDDMQIAIKLLKKRDEILSLKNKFNFSRKAKVQYVTMMQLLWAPVHYVEKNRLYAIRILKTPI